LLDTQLIDGAHAFRANTQPDISFFIFQPEAVFLKVGDKAPTGFIVGMGNFVSAMGRLPVT